MKEDNTKTQATYVSTEPVYLYPCDRKEGIYESMNDHHLFQVLSIRKETWTLQTKQGQFILGFGNPFFNREYRDELLKALGEKKELVKWLQTQFNKCNFQMVEMPVMIKIHSTVRLVQNEQGMWLLFFPDGSNIMGHGNGSWDSPAFTGIREGLKDYYSSKILTYIKHLFKPVR